MNALRSVWTRGAPMVALWAGACAPQSQSPAPRPPPVNPPCPAIVTAADALTFHGDRARTGWNRWESTLAPASVASPAFGWLWNSEPFDVETIDDAAYAPHLYASPLYADGVPISGGVHAGTTASVVVAATSNAWVYAVNACDPGAGDASVPAGTILWRTRLGAPQVVSGLDGGVPVGVLGTPIIDRQQSPPRIYVASASATAGWQVFALDLGDGAILPGWPVTIDDAALAPVNRNGPARFQAAPTMSQRGALNLSPTGNILYVPFGSYQDRSAGWLVAVDTRAAMIASAFSSAPSTAATGNGGIWGPGGPAVDTNGTVFATTGNSPDNAGAAPQVWGDSLLEWTPDLRLAGTYTPFNYCQLDSTDADLGGASPVLLPDADPGEPASPRMVAFGGKQGNVYLLGRDRLPGSLDARPPCTADSSSDRSLLPPDVQPQFGARGPLNVFGPYSETHGDRDFAKMRTTPAFFQGAGGDRFLFVTGTTKAAADSTKSVAPGLVRLRIVAADAPYLAVDGTASSTAFVNPGSPVITSAGGDGGLVWVLDENAPRSASLLGSGARKPVLYAIDATTLEPIWRSPPGLLDVGGKYATPVVAHGFVFAGTDRVQAFGVRP
jgi:hypothetical protein